MSRALTVQVKTVEQPTPAGGKGLLTTGVVLPSDCPAEYLAVVRSSDEVGWMYPIEEALRSSKQAVPRLYWYVDNTTASLGALNESPVEGFRLERMLADLASAAD